MSNRKIAAIVTGIAVAGCAGSAFAATIDSIDRHVRATGPGEEHTVASATDGLFDQTVFVLSPLGLPPVSSANQLSTVELLDQGSSLLSTPVVIKAGGRAGRRTRSDRVAGPSRFSI